jgi:beta-N-acetylglucosaminidase|tara:strand:- start:498 stop:689 length:192 start_codon:yes stop_codon:yes gene_type:complete
MINRTKINKQIEKAKGGKLQDMTGDNKVTQKDVLVARGVLKKQGDKFVAAQYGGQISKIKRRK